VIASEIAARIRRLFFAEHWKVGTISAELGAHPDAVRRVIQSDRFNPSPARPVPSSILDPYKVFIEETLRLHPRLRATRLFEMLKGRGYPGSCVQLRRYVARVRPTTRAEAYLRLRTLPGEQGQVDWGHFGKIKIGHAERVLNCFVMVLSWSRALFARFFLDQTTESFLLGHVLAFDYFGGVPRTLLYDNLKSAVVERQGDHIRYGESLLDFCGHYHFAPHPCAPARGNEKGKVERAIQYLRHAFFAARRFSSLEDLNRQLAAWIETIANQRTVPTDPERRLVKDALAQERPRLLPLPQHPYPCDRVLPISSGKTPYIRFDLNDYSIPDDQAEKPLILIASDSEVRIVNSVGHVYARHVRSYDRGQIIEDPAHIAALVDKKRHAHQLRGRDRLRSSCKHADAFIDALAHRNEPLGTHTRRLLQLLDSYGADLLDAALAVALDNESISAASVAYQLDQQARTAKRPPRAATVELRDERLKHLRVVPHDLGAYDRLTKKDKP